MTILLEKSKEVERRTQELTALQAKILDQWNWYNHCGRTWGWQCRECKRVLPLIKADEARVPSFQARIKSAQDSLSFLQSLANATSQSLSTPPPSKNLPSQKVLNSIESLQEHLKQDLQKAMS